MNEIIIHKEQTGFYSAEFLGPKGAEVHSLFGTSVIPTPFTLQAPAGEVIATIRSKNPGFAVYFCDSCADCRLL